jgi:hypothetical protein
MPKPQTFPNLYDNALQIHIKNLKNWGYLEPNQTKGGIHEWSKKGNLIGKISFYVNTQSQPPFIELSYSYNDQPRKYKVYLTSAPSNLNKGKIWYFLCPHTNKRCRKLYSIGGYFYHREAFKNCMYDSQKKSKYERYLDKTYGVLFKTDEVYKELYKKHFKHSYAGKPTKKYLKLKEQISKAESINEYELQRALLS